MRHLASPMKGNIPRTMLLTLGLCLLLSAGCTGPGRDASSAEESSERPEMKRAPVPGGELEYDVRGDGEPVLLIHGAFIAAAFLPLMEEPALADYRLIRYHRRGFAGSTAPDGPLEHQVDDAAALLRHVGVERAHIVGHSGGGRIALKLSLDAPEAVHSLTVLEPPNVGPAPSRPEFYKEVIQPATERYQAGDTVGAVDIFMKEMVTGSDWRREIARHVPGGPEQADTDAPTFFEDRDSREGWVFDAEEASRLSDSIPILYVWGSETRPFLKESSDLFRTWLPRAEEHRVQGVGHSLQMEDPQAVAEGIAEFLRRHPLDKRSNQ